MKHKIGDTVRIRSKEWMDAQEKTPVGIILGPEDGKYFMPSIMQSYAGKLAQIFMVYDEGYYNLDVDNQFSPWEDWMFDPDYSDDGPLEAEDAIRALLDGDTLYDREGKPIRFSDIEAFMSLYSSPPKRKSLMTRWEVLDWANSEASRGWVVCIKSSETWGEWRLPQFYGYEESVKPYQRARLLPDLSGVDESTIQGFEVEAEE